VAESLIGRGFHGKAGRRRAIVVPPAGMWRDASPREEHVPTNRSQWVGWSSSREHNSQNGYGPIG
jgi:hypothetical protein